MKQGLWWVCDEGKVEWRAARVERESAALRAVVVWDSLAGLGGGWWLWVWLGTRVECGRWRRMEAVEIMLWVEKRISSVVPLGEMGVRLEGGRERVKLVRVASRLLMRSGVVVGKDADVTELRRRTDSIL